MANFTNQPISSSYERVLQIDGGEIQNGLGQPVDGTINSLTATTGFVGNLTGTATNAISSSYALTASYLEGAIESASYSTYAETSSISVSSSYALTASYAENVPTVDTGSLLTTASISDATITFTKGDATTFDIVVDNVSNAFTSSIAISASHSVNADSAISASHAVNADVAITASYVENTISASYALTSTSASHALNADNALTASYVENAISASHSTYAETASYATDFEVAGTLTALNATITNLTTVYETSSIIYSSGSNQLGDEAVDIQTLYGVVDVKTGPLLVTGSLKASSITGSLLGTASFAEGALSSSYALTASYALNAEGSDTGSLLVTASISDATITFTKGDASTFDIVVNNVENASTASIATSASYALNADNAITASYVETAQTASYVLNAVSASYALTASYLEGAIESASYAVSASQADNSNNAVSASYALTASYAENAGVTVDTGSLLVTASAALNVITFTKGDASTFNIIVDTGSAVTVDTGSLLTTASFSGDQITFTKGDGSTFAGVITSVTSSISASYALTASYVETAQTASYVLNAISSSYATTASYVETAQTASYVLNAVSASYALTASYLEGAIESASYAVSASQADNSNNAVSASYADFAATASFITGSNVVGFVATASHALTGGDPFPYTGSAIISGSLGVTGLVDISGSLVVNNIQISGSFNIGNTRTYSGDSIVSSTVAPSYLFTINPSGSRSAFFDYYLVSQDGFNARAGRIVAVWNENTANTTEMSTTDIGDTSEIIWAFGTGNAGENIYIYPLNLPTQDYTVKWDLKLI